MHALFYICVFAYIFIRHNDLKALEIEKKVGRISKGFKPWKKGTTVGEVCIYLTVPLRALSILQSIGWLKFKQKKLPSYWPESSEDAMWACKSGWKLSREIPKRRHL